MQQQFAQTNVPDEQWDLVCLFLWYWITTSICHCSCGFGADGANKDQRPNVLHMSRWPPVLWAQPQHLGKYTWFRVASGFTKFGLKLLFKTLFDRLFLHFYNSGLCFKIRVIPQPKHASLIPDHSLTKKNPKQNKKKLHRLYICGESSQELNHTLSNYISQCASWPLRKRRWVYLV